MFNINVRSKEYGGLKGIYRFRLRSWEVITIFLTLLFGLLTLTGLFDTSAPMVSRLVAGIVSGLLLVGGIFLVVRQMVRSRNIVAVYEHGMVICSKKTGDIRRSFAWADVAFVYEYGYAAGFRQGNRAAAGSNRVRLTLRDGAKLAFINNLTDMEAFSWFVRGYVGNAQKSVVFARWDNDGELRAGNLCLDRIGLRDGTISLDWWQIERYKCGTEALEFMASTPRGPSMVKISWSGLPNLGSLDLLIQHVLSKHS